MFVKKTIKQKFLSQVVNETSLLGNYFFEMTTKSFRIDDDGKLVVNQKNLDRDPPNENKLSFQVKKERKKERKRERKREREKERKKERKKERNKQRNKERKRERKKK